LVVRAFRNDVRRSRLLHHGITYEVHIPTLARFDKRVRGNVRAIGIQRSENEGERSEG
jgi:hypothetical protein